MVKASQEEMSSVDNTPAPPGPSDAPNIITPQTPILSVACRILRSPSHESVTTDLSLFSVSSVDSVGGRRLLNFSKCDRGHSPNPDCRNQNRPADIPEILWFEEETELIRSCAALSSAVGLQKSFSTSDISQLPSPDEGPTLQGLRNAVSELALNSLQRSGFLLEHARLDHTSRSCSTWVAVGDIVSTSQLPSPHGGQASSSTNTTQPPACTPPPPAFTAADFIRSVNKKVRQNYIRRRLLTTYKALERLSQSEFNLDRLEVTPSTAQASLEPCSQSVIVTSSGPTRLTVPGSSPTPSKSPTTSSSTNAAMLRAAKSRAGKNLPLTIRDVERERGKPLSKYERNMMIFNWLHTLDDTAFVEGVP
ncbi:uncharacterized protein LOC126734101 isoform X1 [Anthonomus grandis grandis]|uniref:uncharacterized protein LOC126734101 isoform X1 n=1 Tax=Anthonomus grandis grandis TaxID=2921223 RepID=UPI0021659200|nr:uncharacterized protein LOC126734101 isoform X1 [Anthonomus grandis grandis]XP_050293581.1 uncharacterized protein LOC126734101 isoform X1 [Anthonomus grandis grandis]